MGYKDSTYYRVSDLALVYKKTQSYQNYDTPDIIYGEYWDEYVNGGAVEYQGTFTKQDFHIPGCIYTAASFLE